MIPEKRIHVIFSCLEELKRVPVAATVPGDVHAVNRDGYARFRWSMAAPLQTATASCHLIERPVLQLIARSRFLSLLFLRSGKSAEPALTTFQPSI
jgi:hypothetical protein